MVWWSVEIFGILQNAGEKRMKTRMIAFAKGEAVLCVAAVCALITMILVPPDGEYIGYIDLRVLCLLLCLMAVVAGVQSCGAFQWLAEQLLPAAAGIQGPGGHSGAAALLRLHGGDQRCGADHLCAFHTASS